MHTHTSVDNLMFILQVVQSLYNLQGEGGAGGGREQGGRKEREEARRRREEARKRRRGKRRGEGRRG